MGINIDLHVYDAAALTAALEAKGAVGKDGLLRRIMEKCGLFVGDRYLLLNNEYYDGHSPYYQLAKLIDSAFEVRESFHVILELTYDRKGAPFHESVVNHVDAGEVAEELGIVLKEE